MFDPVLGRERSAATGGSASKPPSVAEVTSVGSSCSTYESGVSYVSSLYPYHCEKRFFCTLLTLYRTMARMTCQEASFAQLSPVGKRSAWSLCVKEQWRYKLLSPGSPVSHRLLSRHLLRRARRRSQVFLVDW